MLHQMCFLIFVLASSSVAFGANILILNDVASGSHHVWNYAYAKGLMAKDHNITMLGSDAHKGVVASPQYHPIVFEGIYDELSKGASLVDAVHQNPIEAIQMFMEYSYLTCSYYYETEGFQRLWNYPDDFKFDLIAIDLTLMGTCLYPFIQKFNYPPTIGITAFLLPPYLSSIFGNDLHPSYLPWYNLYYTEDMTFLERVNNYVFTYLDTSLKHYYEYPRIERLYKNALGEKIDSANKIRDHINVLLCNINPIFHNPQPIPPNIIPVGGLHTGNTKALPKDIQVILDKSKNGVFVFSLGTNVRSDQLSVEKREAILGAFGALPYTVLWKFESELDNLPKNVIIRKWLPINDILTHPKVKLFISHGGALSVQEAMFHGVPILGMPFFGDQHININSLAKKNLAVKIDYTTLTTEKLSKAINNILNNQVLIKNIQDVSKRFRDLPEHPLDKAVFWTEYTLRHDGAKFLNPKSRKLPFFVSSSLDVILFLMLFVTTSVLVVGLCIKKLCNLFKPKQKTE